MNFITKETLQNLRAHGIQSFVVAIISVAVGWIIVASSVSDLTSIALRQAELEAAGANVFSVSSESGFPVSECVELSAVDGVNLAGALTGRDRAKVLNRSDYTTISVAATAGYIRIGWGIEPESSTSVVAGGTLSDTLGIRVDDELDIRLEAHAATWRVATIAPRTTRIEGGDHVLAVEAAAEGTTNECLVEVEAENYAALETYLTMTYQNRASVTPLVDRLDVSANAWELSYGRTSLWLPLLLPVFVMSLEAMVAYARRKEWALYRLVGQDDSRILIAVVAEIAIVIWLPYATGGFLALWGGGTPPVSVAEFIMNDFVRGILLLLMTPLIVYFVAARSSTVVSALKGK